MAAETDDEKNKGKKVQPAEEKTVDVQIELATDAGKLAAIYANPTEGGTLQVNGTVTMWTFEAVPDQPGWYYISDGNGNYLNITATTGNEGTVTLGEKQVISVTEEGLTITTYSYTVTGKDVKQAHIMKLPGVDKLGEIEDTLEIQHHVEVEGGVVVETVFGGSTEASFKMETNENVAADGSTVDSGFASEEDFALPKGAVSHSGKDEEPNNINVSFKTPVFSTFTVT